MSGAEGLQAVERRALIAAADAMPIETLQGADKASVWLRERAHLIEDAAPLVSDFELLVSVLAGHPNYSTRLDDDQWRATCDGTGCSWYSGHLPPAGHPRGAGAAARAHREHVAVQLLAAGVRVEA